MKIVGGPEDFRTWLRPLRMENTEPVFGNDDSFPGWAKIALIPYLSFQRRL